MKSTPDKQSSLEETCGTCRYYLEDPEVDEAIDPDDDEMTGICRRYPPVVYPGYAPASVYPDVSQNGWCGEFVPGVRKS